jgi:F-type H+-transporting ATPase subunit epsilon
MANPFGLEIVTPDKVFYKGTAEMVIVRTTEGDIGILKDHTPYVAGLSIGKLRLKLDGKFTEAAIAGGFVQVDKEKTTILTEAAEWADDIDIDRAKKSKEEAQNELKNTTEQHKKEELEFKIKKAENRIDISQK